jgi:hypothetical protein
MQPTNNPLSTLLAALALAGLAVGQNETALTLDQCIQILDNQLPPFQPSDFHFSGNVRTYYVQAEQLSWDYVPTGWDNWLGVPINDSVRAQEAGYVSAGWKWEKAVYRGYTDSSFTQKTAQPSWQGINGPTLRAEVGDMIQILFVNSTYVLGQKVPTRGRFWSPYSRDISFDSQSTPVSLYIWQY